MKILIDPVYTGRPSTCSTSYLAWEIIDTLIKERDDVFFYLLYPSSVQDDKDEMKFLSRHSDRVQLIAIDQLYIDRMQTMFSFPMDLWNVVAPDTGLAWDADILLTSRVPQITQFRVNSGRYTAFEQGSYRAIFGLDEMPMFPFRKTISWSSGITEAILSNYLLSDGIVVNNLWTKDNVLKLAKNFLSPFKVKELRDKIHEALPVKIKNLRLRKSPKYVPGEDFTVVFAGRPTGTRNFKGVAELFRKQFSFPIGKNKKFLKFAISTQSQSMGSSNFGYIDFIELQQNDRKAFYKMLKEEAKVVVNLSTVEDFSLSTYEPLSLGVPVIVPHHEWTDFLGPDYPFRAKDMLHAYVLISQFVNNYEAMYKRFKAWSNTYWKEFVKSDANITTSEVLGGLMYDFKQRLEDHVEENGLGGKYIAIADEIEASDWETIDLHELLQEYDFDMDKDWSRVPIARRANLILMKVLLNLRGFRDCKETGVMTRGSE